MLRQSFSRTGQVSTNVAGRATNAFGTLITCGTATHALSAAFTDLIAATKHDTFWVKVLTNNTRQSTTRTDMLLNLYIGTAGNEQPLISNMVCGWSGAMLGGGTTDSSPRVYQFPLYIPSGTRISAKGQSLISADTVAVWIKLEGGGQQPHWCGQAVETLGATVASSIGTSVTPGGAAEGLFTPIGTNVFEWGYVLPMIHGILGDTTANDRTIDVDIGTVSATIRDLVNFPYLEDTGERTAPLNGGVGRFCKILAGTALQIRSQSSSAAVEPQDWCLYGVY